ncbi:glycosyltransferase family 4 protein [Rhodococcus sp. BP-241]|uniref:glycosyltransferase family 4 protein n=1 Tax=Rhodococcus sp. BP-241 TaxID=2739441 RepID=UPI001C9A4D90|nr:glycosyltransferase family 4 protein [Rhodococcus sp. BP-241]MBY6709511.1 glycosyltransferase family 4 protein [Rhodococcus sp. BP-241]
MASDVLPVRYINFGIDKDFFTYSPYDDTDIILSLGNDIDRDYVTLFRAFDSVVRSRPTARLIVQGHTPDMEFNDRRIEFLPKMSHLEVRELYSRAAVVAVATRDNCHGSGMTVCLEAMASGRPVVVTDTLGMTDYVTNGVDGKLVPVGDHIGMAGAILDFLSQPDKSREAGQQGRRRVELVNNTERMASALASFISD